MRVRPVGIERQLAHLRRRGFAYLVAVRVADLHREQPSEGVEIPLAVQIFEVAALPAHDDRDVAVAVVAHTCEVQPEVLASRALRLALAQSEAIPTTLLAMGQWQGPIPRKRPTIALAVQAQMVRCSPRRAPRKEEEWPGH